MSLGVGPDTQRQARVDAAREGWIRRLIDLSRRNNLLYFRDLRTGTIDLSEAPGQALRAFLAGESVPLSAFAPRADRAEVAEQPEAAEAPPGAEEPGVAEEPDGAHRPRAADPPHAADRLGVAAPPDVASRPDIADRVREIRRRALSNLEERGLETLFLAMGMASWRPSDEGRPAEAAVLLVPGQIDLRGRDGRALGLRRRGDLQVNLVLTHVLEVEHGAQVSPDELIELLQGDEGEPFDPEPAYERLRRAARHVPGFTVKPRLVLGNFAYQKTAMVRDLREFGDAMAGHELISAIAGDPDARAAVQARRTPADPGEIDRTPADAEFLVLDADSSQQLVIRQALQDQDGVVHGPPGTGKSQTIANTIAECAARGRRVLFVAEKRAALEVVLERLRGAGLGHLALDLHGAEVSRREIMARFAESLAIVRSTYPVDAEATHARFEQRRSRLVEHVTRLHAPQAPSGMSVFELQGRLIPLERIVRSATRWRSEALARLDRTQADAIVDLLDEAAGFEALFVRDHPSPWTGAELPDGATVDAALRQAKALARRWPVLIAALERLQAEAGFAPAVSLDEARTQMDLLARVADTLARYSAELFATHDLPALAAALEPARRGAFGRLWAFARDADYRAALRTARRMRRAGPIGERGCLDEIAAAHRLSARWAAMTSTGSRPHAVPSLDGARQALGDVEECLAWLGPRTQSPDPGRGALAALGAWAAALAADEATPYRLPRLIAIERELAERGVRDLVEELRREKPEPARYARSFEHAWLASCMDLARLSDPALAGFNGRTHDRVVAEFARLDRERIRIAGDRVRRAHAERVVEVMNAHPEQEAAVKREAAKKARHVPFRRLVAEASPVLMALRPCWMASPLSVSHLLPADRRLFDVVMFDEASQVLPEDAVPSLLRGAHAIVAGDRRQLPPTTFFMAGEEEDEQPRDEAATQGFESILDLMSGLLDPWPLDWHYRSRDESLIAFSNRHIYEQRLVTFPAPERSRAVEHVLVAQAQGLDGQEESAPAEVRRVVELVLDHAVRRPDETLGVIALGIRHALRVETAIDAALRTRPELDPFFDQSRPERFFVKNLERVQGDERDAIILTVGYGKDRSGRLPYRFGPLLTQGGERRLNVATTRARNRMTVVSSFTHHDMDPGRSKARGVELLRLFLEYAAGGGARTAEETARGFEPGAFERDVFEALSERGVALLPQWGASRYRIDLVAQHPREPGRLVLAIECDGAAYHAAHSARDRDRLRRQHLESIGWRFHRIWSTDWFLRRDQEILRALAAYETAVTAADRRGAEPREARGEPDAAPATGALATRDRTPRPGLDRRPSIADYSPEELRRLVEWIQSDDQLRTDDEILAEAIEELGFDRRGSRITAAIRAAIEAWRRA